MTRYWHAMTLSADGGARLGAAYRYLRWGAGRCRGHSMVLGSRGAAMGDMGGIGSEWRI